ncbi:putative secreted protein [Clostridium bornimense]|uniref:Putative secreted protein n=1 Tax=Clostridium bornimense TaxID=1216932 RepID=W6S3I8_9CLOT|nr:right-handed parallel beta-helix repeat-containing protein [Clostridium bornimense]CDM70474.1 putative secreted protein [Clostridium bornimense]
MNKSKIASIFLATSIFTTTIIGNYHVFASDQLFTENFQSGSKNWKESKGKWSIVNYNNSKAYYQSSTNVEAASKAGKTTWTNYSVESEVTIEDFNGSKRVMLCGRYTDKNNYYSISLYNKDGGTLEIRSKAKGKSKTLKKAKISIKENTTYKVKLELNGNTLKAYLDGKLITTANDKSLSKGAIGIVTSKASAKFDNIVVSSIDKTSSDSNTNTDLNTNTTNDNSSNNNSSSNSDSNNTTNDTTSSGTYGKDTGATTNGTVITVESNGTTLEKAVSSAKSGDTILIKGTIKSSSITLKDNITIKGESGAKIDFSNTSNGGRGITITGKNNTIKDLEIYNAKDNAIYVNGGDYNRFENLNIHNNADTGLQISNGASYNYIYNCYSHHNVDSKGENPDGFAVKLHSGEGNVFEKCKAEYNVDDGWDFYAAHGAVTLVNCESNYNGEVNGVKGDGNGFKLGGVDNKESGKAAHLDPLNHVLINCSAKGNKKNGFDRNNQSGIVTMKNCIADGNEGKNYNWPLKGKPSALGYEVTFGKAIIDSCTSKNGSNNISGATLQGNCQGF